MEDKLAEIIAQLDHVLLERDSSFPTRTTTNDLRLQKLLDAFVQEIQSLLESGCVHTSVLDKESGAKLVDNCLFLCGYMKSGTTLLLELLDSHPELITLPGDSFFKDRRFLVGDDSAATYAETTRNRWLRRIINPTGQAPFWLFGKQAKPYVDFMSHYDQWMKIVDDPARGHLLSTLLAFNSANPAGPPRPKMWVEKTPGNEFDIKRILHYFPRAKFLHIIRDPRENYASVKRLYQTRKWDWNPLLFARKVAESCRLSVENQNQLGEDRYFVIQYEALTENPRDTLEQVCEYLGIAWSDCLLKPTINHIPAQSNTMYSDRRVTGTIRPTKKNKWIDTLNKREKRAILNVANDVRGAGYDWNVSTKDRILHSCERLVNRMASLKGNK